MPDLALRVTVTFDDGVWTAVVDDVPNAVTQARRISELDPHVREQLAVLLDLPASSLVLEYHLHAHGRS